MWNYINFYKTNIEHDTGRALLIALPKNRKYGGYKFWVGYSLVSLNKMVRVSFREDMTFKLFNKRGDEVYVDGFEIKEICSQIPGNEIIEEEIIRPEKIINTEVDIDESLII